MEDNLKKNGRIPKKNGRRPKKNENGRQPQYFGKSKMTLIC